MAHIFGLPHSFGEWWEGVGTPTPGFGMPTIPGPGPVISLPPPAPPGGGGGGPIYPGCPIDGDDDGCGSSKKRYTITIDNATGQCIKIKRQKSRKRRRRLASMSDIKDLAALKQVLGGGKAFDTWIATRGR